jgi:hypothetical protein
VTVLPDAQHSAIHPDPRSRQGAVDHLAWTIECSEALGSELLCGRRSHRLRKKQIEEALHRFNRFQFAR